MWEGLVLGDALVATVVIYTFVKYVEYILRVYESYV